MNTTSSNLKIIPIPAFTDNYIWLIHNDTHAIVIDPGDANVVLDVLTRHKLTLHGILITHHHNDHTGGVEQLISLNPRVLIYAPLLEKFSFIHTAVTEADSVTFPEFSLEFSVIDLPGHTLGHIAYFVTIDANRHLLFCGDTLFGAGCGRLFEGTAEQMWTSLQKLAALPSTTEVYSAHEYTLHNIDFALTLEPNNKALLDRNASTKAIRALGLPSLPSTIALELATNPFLRTHSHAIQSSLSLTRATPVQIFSSMRTARNHHTYTGA